MKNVKSLLLRPSYGLAAAVMLVAGLAPALVARQASAAQVTARSIQMSSSTPGASSVSYKLTFTPGTSVGAAAGALVIDFCGDTPLIGATCAFDANTVPTISSTNLTSTVGTATTVSGGTPTHAVKVTGLTFVSGTPFTLTLSGSGSITNPANPGTFFARLMTYTTSANAAGYVPATTTGGATTTGTIADSGGMALSAAAAISLTARVMETLSFCVYNATCGDSPAVTLGSGSPAAIGTGSVSTAADLFSLSTNALSGAIVNLYGSSANGGLPTSGSNTLASVSTSTPTALTINGANGQFGIHVSGTATSGTFTIPTLYAGTGTSYAYDSTAAGTTYGTTIANTTTAPMNAGVGTLTYAAVAGNTTPAGIYTATHQLIATGTF
jgi:hypothetical protein